MIKSDTVGLPIHHTSTEKAYCIIIGCISPTHTLLHYSTFDVLAEFDFHSKTTVTNYAAWLRLQLPADLAFFFFFLSRLFPIRGRYSAKVFSIRLGQLRLPLLLQPSP